MKLVAVGDSITEGYPYSKHESWVEYLARELKLEILNHGICGDLTRGMRKRFELDVLAYTPTHVIILGGANDAAAGYPLAEVSANFEAMVEMSRQHGISPMLGLPTPSLLPAEEKYLMQYRNWLKDYAGREGIPYIDFYSPFLAAINEGQADRLFVDEVHPSLEGYKLMGETAVHSLAGMLIL
ncbi:hypothetical protein JCM15765_16360 [Paradesulfitobacterium aromaticivorans]